MKKQKAFWIIILCMSVVFLTYKYKQMRTALLDDAFPLKQEWKVCLNGDIQGISGGANHRILVRTVDGLYGYDSISGNLVWHFTIGKQVTTFPARVAGETAFVSDDANLLAFDLNSGSILWTDSLHGKSSWIPDVSEQFVLINTISDAVDVYTARTGKKLWGTLGGRGYTPAFIDGNTVYIVDRAIKAFEANTGNSLWQMDNHRATGLSAFADGIIYFIEYPGNGTLDLVAYNVRSKTEIWRIHSEENNPKGIYVYRNYVFFAKNDALLLIDSLDGNIRLQKTLAAPSNLAFWGSNVYVLEQFNRRIDVFEIKTGNELGFLQLSSPQVFASEVQEMIVMDNHLFFSKGCELFAFEMK